MLDGVVDHEALPGENELDGLVGACLSGTSWPVGLSAISSARAVRTRERIPRTEDLEIDQYTSATRLFGAMLNWFSVSAMKVDQLGMRRNSSVSWLAQSRIFSDPACPLSTMQF
jgi:hypothetical protein